MPALGVVGRSGSGKTTLITALIPVFRTRGLRVSTIKHAHHDLPFDQPGKDSFRHAEAGAAEVILTTGAGFALYSGRPVALPDLLARLAPVDLVLVEGFKNDPIPKLEVYRPALAHAPLWREMPVLAVACDVELPNCAAPVLRLDAVEQIADFITAAFGLNRQ